MREIESDGFITREEDLMKSEHINTLDMMQGGYPIPSKKCDYPKCEECEQYQLFKGKYYCTVPMVITKQIYIEIAERIALLEETVTALENTVYDEILGDDGDFIPDEA